MQQRDQTTPALVGDAAFCLDPGADLAGCPRQRLGDPVLQLVLLRIAQATRAAAETKARQTLDAFFLIQAIPSADGVIVEKQDPRNDIVQLIPSSSSTSALARRARRCATDPSRPSSIRSRRDSGSRKPPRIMQGSRVGAELICKGILRVPRSWGISTASGCASIGPGSVPATASITFRRSVSFQGADAAKRCASSVRGRTELCRRIIGHQRIYVPGTSLGGGGDQF